MDLNKCAKCGVLFSSNDDICPKCISKDLQDLGTVRNFMMDNPEITDLNEISEQTGISQNDILRFISKGRLDDIKTLGKYFKCASCSVPIVRGKYCDACMNKFHTIRTQLLNNK